MKNLHIFKYNKNRSRQIAVVLHGASGDSSSPLITQVVGAVNNAGIDALTFDFGFASKGEVSDTDIPASVAELGQAIEHATTLGYKDIILIGKSIGGIVAAKYLESATCSHHITKLLFLGYVLSDVSSIGIQHVPSVVVLQGSNDPYGAPKDIAQSLSAITNDHVIEEIPHSDHGFRDTNDPAIKNYDMVIEKLRLHL